MAALEITGVCSTEAAGMERDVAPRASKKSWFFQKQCL